MTCHICGHETPDSSRFCCHCGKRLNAQNGVITPVQRRRRRRPKGTGSVYKVAGRRNKPYIATVSGKCVGYFSTSSEAIIALDAFIAAHKQLDYHNITFKELYEAWKPGHDKTVGKSAREQAANSFNKSKDLYNRKFAELRTPDFQAVIDSVEATGKSLSISQKLKQLYTMLSDFAVQNDVVDRNYASYCLISAKEKNPEKNDRIFSEAEIKTIWSFVGSDYYDRAARILLVLIYTGARISELCLMERGKVYLEQRTMIGGVKTEAGKNRPIPIHEKVLPFIKEWMSMETDSIYLIPTETGAPLDKDHYRRTFYKLMKACKIEGAMVKTARHTASSLMVAAGVDPDLVKRILGHASITTTLDVYTHRVNNELVEAVNRIR